MMSTKKAYEEKLQVQLDEFQAEIDRLKARADKAEEPSWHKKQLEALQEKQAVAREKLGELRAAGDDAWEDLKEGVGTAWNSVGDALKSAAKQFKQS